MKVFLINQFFRPDMTATAQLLADMAEDRPVAGWHVTDLPVRGPEHEQFYLLI